MLSLNVALRLKVSHSLYLSKTHGWFALSGVTPRFSHPFNTISTRHISQSFYEQFLSPSCAPIGAAQSLLESVHSHCGLPWWATIMVTTVALRTVLTVPLMAYSMNNSAKLQLLKPKLTELQGELKREVATAMRLKGWTPEYAQTEFHRNMSRIVREQFEANNCHPKKDYILPWIQLPLWISMSLALRNMCGAMVVDGQMSPVLCHDMAIGGALWFPNLLLPDSTWILPVVMCISNLLICEMFALQSQDKRWFNRALTFFIRGITVAMLPIAGSVPSGICFYWTCSSLFGLFQNIFLRLPKVRRALRIQRPPNESQTPFHDLWSAVLTKYRR